ncbi:small RNA-binding protein 11, chloroplastic isoform X2 [Malania oleifera]|uniref:small RNA-binding protein 11, chloroplastic isoform X2 n=1 Tax=Malania oleifera TaxID=397392 RepID=UPI0025AEB29E|nr:small RNA-binding protein 11, chloroplastic isoform X2 [Malania oleifera]
MAALRRISLQFSGHVAFSNPTISRISSSSSSVLPPALLISCRGFVSKLFVGGLSFYTSEKELSEAFSQYGQVVDAKIVMDRVSDRSKGFGFVTFASEDEAHKAISEMNGKTLFFHLTPMHCSEFLKKVEGGESLGLRGNWRKWR